MDTATRTQHTPEPWLFQGGDRRMPDILIGTNDMWIAKMTTGVGYDQTDAEAEANALHIVACVNAAPALLAALEAMVTRFAEPGCATQHGEPCAGCNALRAIHMCKCPNGCVTPESCDTCPPAAARGTDGR